MAVITCFAAPFNPKTWALCNGQSLAIAQNQALFALLGTTFGGNGVTTFNLPDLRGRVPIGTGQGSGLANYSLGEPGGSATTTLNLNTMPAHNHNGNISVALPCSSDAGSEPSPDGNVPASFNQGYAANAVAGINMAAPTYTAVIQNAGGSQPFSLMPPYLGMNYIICLQGIFPSRN